MKKLTSIEICAGAGGQARGSRRAAGVQAAAEVGGGDREPGLAGARRAGDRLEVSDAQMTQPHARCAPAA